MQAVTDSTRRLRTTYETTPGHREQARGFEGRFTFTLLDSTGGQVFRRVLQKQAFYKVGNKDVVIESEAFAPELLGYSAAFGALVFNLPFMVPDSDVGGNVLLLLDLKGQVLRICKGEAVGGPEVAVGLSSDGRALLTPDELLRPGRPPLRLDKPDADLAGAFFLSDTTLLLLYEPGKSRARKLPDGSYAYGRDPSPQQLRAPNAFVRHTVSGRELARFRYRGFYEELGFSIPWHFLRATATGYLLDERQGLYVLPRAAPAQVALVRFAQMSAVGRKAKPTEAHFELYGENGHFAFYIDTINPRSIRYQKLRD
ncbi:hypothetical protein GCM10023185_18510 [Hymenobacter saemangeumensis]|uniref:WG repeat-containing protein n=1 Tax=Hymenobacter saemangeumensis TaxID=1084522 RepID=A0ABP8IC80_9BACT